jgi:hypothetical protein
VVLLAGGLLMPLMSVGRTSCVSSTGQPVGPPVDLPRAAYTTFVPGLCARHASSSVSWLRQLILEIRVRIPHAVDVADLARQIEDDVAAADEIVHRGGVAHVGRAQRDRALDAADVERIAAVVRNQRVDDQYIGAKSRPRRWPGWTDEAHPPVISTRRPR